MAAARVPRDLAGATVVVTGAASGIGRACVQRFADRHGSVVGIDADVAGLEEAHGDDQRVTRLGCDVADAAAVEKLAAQLLGAGRVPLVLVNVVGGAQLATVEEMDYDHWTSQVQLNLTSVYLMCHAFLPAMTGAGRGAVVNTASGWGFMPAPRRSAYAAAKAGLVAFSRAVAAEVASSGVRVNVVAPGPIATPRMRALVQGDSLSQSTHAGIPMGRLGEPDEVAAAVSFLASDEASFICGQVLHVNGGVFMP